MTFDIHMYNCKIYKSPLIVTKCIALYTRLLYKNLSSENRLTCAREHVNCFERGTNCQPSAFSWLLQRWFPFFLYLILGIQFVYINDIARIKRTGM